MQELLEKLQEQRSAAVKAFESFAAPILAEGRDLTEDEEKRHKELLKDVKRFDKRHAEIEEMVTAERQQAEARAELTKGVVTVKSEPKTYEEGSPNSWVADVVRSSSPIWKGHGEAMARLQRHSHEMAVDAQADAKVRSHVTRQLRDLNRSENGIEARRAVTDLLEQRAMDTTSGSGGSFVTPVYMEQDYAPYNQFGRVFIDQCNKQPLPEYGMTVYLPAVQSPAGVAVQGSQGQGVTETDPTAGYLSANLTTEAGQVTISQQLLDRAGPNFQFDKMVFDQLQRDYSYVVNQFAVTTALAGAGSVTLGSAPTAGTEVQKLYGQLAQAKTQTVNSAGVVLPATHAFFTPTQWEWLASRPASDGRPAIVQSPNGSFNSYGTGPNTSIPQGAIGTRMLGLECFEDGGIPLLSTNQQMIVAHMPEVWMFEGALTPRVIPQTFAQNLQVLLQVFSYVAMIVRYPKAVQSLSGAGWVGTPTF